MYGIFGREITIHTVIYGVYIRFWPTLGMLQAREATRDAKAIASHKRCQGHCKPQKMSRRTLLRISLAFFLMAFQAQKERPRHCHQEPVSGQACNPPDAH